jgi:predicted amidohydrolase
MFATGFSMDVARIAEPADGPTHRFLADRARAHQACVVGGLVTPARDGKGRNEAVVFDPAGRELARYAKLRPFSLGGESAHFLAGEQPVVFDWGGFRIAPFICYDLRFPELFRAAVRQGADLFVVIANWPAVRAEHWSTLLRARAVENQAYVVGVNRCGRDPQHEYAGGSLIVDPTGQVLATAASEPCVLTAELHVEIVRGWRHTFPALADAGLLP